MRGTAAVTIKDKHAQSGTGMIDCRCSADSRDILVATADVAAPREKDTGVAINISCGLMTK